MKYVPAPDYSGQATINFIVNDADPGVVEATLSIDVNAVNDVPVADGNTLMTSEDTTLAILVSDFLYSDAEGDPIDSVTITALSLNGGRLHHSGGSVEVTEAMRVSNAELADLTFVPAANSTDQAGFDYQVNDAGDGASSAAMVINIAPVNDVPVGINNTISVDEDQTLTIDASDFTYTDIEGDPLASVTIVALDLHGGTLTLADNTPVNSAATLTPAQLSGLQYVPAANYHGSAAINFVVNDADPGVTGATLSIDIAVSYTHLTLPTICSV